MAYADGLACLNGNAYWSMLIHVQDDTTPHPAKFIQVRFSLPCKETPQWLNRKSPVQKFRLKREQDASVLKEFAEYTHDRISRRSWKRRRGEARLYFAPLRWAKST